MPVRFTTFNIVTMALLGGTVWIGAARFSIRQESNWPLLYYLAVFVYLRTFEGSLNPYWVYVGVINALFLRFEFLGGKLESLLRVVEIVFLCYILWRGIQLVLM